MQYLDHQGKLITESLRDYTKKTVHQDYATLKDFLARWRSAERKHAIVEELAQHGVFFEALADEVGKDFDPFDLVCHVAFDQPPLSPPQKNATSLPA